MVRTPSSLGISPNFPLEWSGTFSPENFKSEVGIL